MLRRTRQVRLVNKVCLRDSSWEQLFIQEKKHVLIGEQKLKHFAPVTRCELLVLNGALKTTVIKIVASALLSACFKIAVQVAVSGKSHGTTSLNVLACLFNTLQEKLFELIPA